MISSVTRVGLDDANHGTLDSLLCVEYTKMPSRGSGRRIGGYKGWVLHGASHMSYVVVFIQDFAFALAIGLRITMVPLLFVV